MSKKIRKDYDKTFKIEAPCCCQVFAKRNQREKCVELNEAADEIYDHQKA